VKRLSCLVGAAACLLLAAPGLAMNGYDDPRVVLSFMDRSLQAAHDILRLTTRISGDEELVFQVKLRGEVAQTRGDEYVLLQLQHQRSHLWLVPLGSSEGGASLSYQGDPFDLEGSRRISNGQLDVAAAEAGFTARHIPHGVEFSIPLSWLDYGEEIGFDAYTVQGRPTETSFVIEEIYDRAIKGSMVERRVSPIMLLNNLCATRK